jgi:5-formyltetrahydrofolate cyclo-ligase
MKDHLRKEIRNKRKNLNRNFVHESAKAMSQNFFSFGFNKFSKIMAYISIENEADPAEIVDSCIRNNVEVFIPGLDSEDMIHPMKYLDSKSLVLGKYNVPEPASKTFHDFETFDLILVPGVAFDLKGNRIGYGKGCYDSFLKNTNALKVGLCYEFQLVGDGIKMETHDIRMDYILTEDRVYEVKDAI